MTTNRPLRVFLCHSSADKPAVRELYQKLRAEPWIEPWLDEEELFPGMDWNLEIEKAIEATDVILVCLSNKSITKEGYVQKEITRALDFAEYKPEGALFIIPVRLEECTPPKRLARWQYADYFAGQQERGMERLLISFKKRFEPFNPVNEMPPLISPIRRENKKLIRLRELLGHTYHVNALAVWGNILVSGGGDTRAIVWDISLGKKIFTAEHDSWVGSVAISGNYIVSSTGKGQISVWDYVQKKQVTTTIAHNGAIRTVFLSNNQQRLFSGGKDRKVKIWSFPDLDLIKEYDYHSSEVRRLIVDDSGSNVFSGDSDGNVFKLDVKLDNWKKILQVSDQIVRSLAFFDKFHILAITASDGEVIAWDDKDGIVKWRVRGHQGHSIGVAFNPDGSLLATGGQDKKINLWDSQNGDLLGFNFGHDDDITSLAFSVDGIFLISASRDKRICVWGANSS
jgi:WD40 repeat protein